MDLGMRAIEEREEVWVGAGRMLKHKVQDGCPSPTDARAPFYIPSIGLHGVSSGGFTAGVYVQNTSADSSEAY